MNTLQQFIQDHEFLTTPEQTAELIQLDRLFPVLVRCGGCRFTCGAQYVPHLLACISAGGDYVRDVSFPVGSKERAASWRPEQAAGFCSDYNRATEPKTEKLKPAAPTGPLGYICPHCKTWHADDHCNARMEDMIQSRVIQCPYCEHEYPEPVKTTQPPEQKRPRGIAFFDESQCGGVFDGFGVISDADSGL